MGRKRRIPRFDPNGSIMYPGQNKIVTDPMGSYTGVPEDADDKPVQDADDL